MELGMYMNIYIYIYMLLILGGEPSANKKRMFLICTMYVASQLHHGKQNKTNDMCLWQAPENDMVMQDTGRNNKDTLGKVTDGQSSLFVSARLYIICIYIILCTYLFMFTNACTLAISNNWLVVWMISYLISQSLRGTYRDIYKNLRKLTNVIHSPTGWGTCPQGLGRGGGGPERP